MKLINKDTGIVEYAGSVQNFPGVEAFLPPADLGIPVPVFLISAVKHELPLLDQSHLAYLDDSLQKHVLLDIEHRKLSNHIYAQYPPDKQAQDDKWSLSYTAKLKAAGVPNLEAIVVHTIGLIFQGQPLEDLVVAVVAKWPSAVYNHVSGSNQVEREAYATHMLTKLVKIGIRTEWAEACIRVGKAAIAEGREPDFPPFPKM